MKNSYSNLLFGAFLGVFLLTLGCSKKSIDSTDATTVSSFDLIQQKILTPSCATSGCHASTSDNTYAQHGLVLEKSVAYQNLIGVNPKMI
jgi:hypothetical protein